MEPQPFVTLWSNFGSHLLSLVYSTLMQWGGNCRMVWSLGAEHQWGPSWRLAATPFKEALCPIVWLILGIGYLGFSSGTSGQEPACQCRRHKRHGFDPWVGKIPWRRAWQPIPAFLPGESPWTEEPGGLQSIGSPRVRHSWSDLAHLRGIHRWLNGHEFELRKTVKDREAWSAAVHGVAKRWIGLSDWATVEDT